MCDVNGFERACLCMFNRWFLSGGQNMEFWFLGADEVRNEYHLRQSILLRKLNDCSGKDYNQGTTKLWCQTPT